MNGYAEAADIKEEFSNGNEAYDVKLHYVYLLLCADGTLYCGYTTDPPKRTAAHNRARGAKYTRSRLPVSLVYCEPFGSKTVALKREAAIKKFTRAQKTEMISAHSLKA